MPVRKTLVAWIATNQITLVKEVAKLSNLRIKAIGTSNQSALPDISSTLKAESCSDIRSMISKYEDAILWIAEPGAFDVSLCDLLRNRNVKTITTTPLSGNMDELVQEADKSPAAKYVPLFRRSAGYGEASDDIEQFGQPISAHCTMTCSNEEGTLWARLFDAMHCVNTLFGTPELVQAYLHSTKIPEEPCDLVGHMTVNMKFTGSRCATLLLSDQSHWKRELQMISEEHSLTFGDHDTSFAQLICDDIQSSESTPADAPRILALCEAARLSCLTGSAELPSRVLEMF